MYTVGTKVTVVGSASRLNGRNGVVKEVAGGTVTVAFRGRNGGTEKFVANELVLATALAPAEVQPLAQALVAPAQNSVVEPNPEKMKILDVLPGETEAQARARSAQR